MCCKMNTDKLGRLQTVDHQPIVKQITLEMWANAQRDGHPADYMWRPLFNDANFG